MGMFCDGISYKGYTIERNYCNCHAETCCCKDYYIHKNGIRIDEFYDVNKAKEYIDKILT